MRMYCIYISWKIASKSLARFFDELWYSYSWQQGEHPTPTRGKENPSRATPTISSLSRRVHSAEIHSAWRPKFCPRRCATTLEVKTRSSRPKLDCRATTVTLYDFEQWYFKVICKSTTPTEACQTRTSCNRITSGSLSEQSIGSRTTALKCVINVDRHVAPASNGVLKIAEAIRASRAGKLEIATKELHSEGERQHGV